MFKLFLSLSLALLIQRADAAIAVIYGHNSIPAGERGFAQTLARHVERWYAGCGIDCELSDDRNLGSSLQGTQLAVLVYLSQPDAEQLSALRSYVKRGGKLIVFYSASTQLAQIMGMKNLGYQASRSDGRWSSMLFTEGEVRGVPHKILQGSRNLIAMAPVSGESRVIAWWHDREGVRTDPAWLSSESGYWMTHVLLADGNADAKARMLLALAASFDSSRWLAAARVIVKDAATVGRSGGADGMARLAAKVSQASRRQRAQRGAAALLNQERAVNELIRKQSGFNAYAAAEDLRSSTWELYGVMQQPRGGEIRAVWDHSGIGLYPGNWKLTCELLKNAGFTDIYVNVAGAGFAYYHSNVLPRSTILIDHGDQLAACVKAALPLGLRVHAWILCFSTERATADRIKIFKQRGWLLDLPDDRPSRWLDPAVPEVRSYLVKAVQEMTERYNISGVHLDFARYPDFNSSLGAGSRKRFESATGKRIINWPADVKPGGVSYISFAGWRAQQVSIFVSNARRAVKRESSGKLLTAAVFGKYPSCLAAVGQDWESWLNINLVDYVIPMNYTENLSSFNEWLTDQCKTRSQRLKVVPGIGVTANESRLDAAQVIDQINLIRSADCPGFALFDLNTTLRQKILPVLRLGMTAP